MATTLGYRRDGTELVVKGASGRDIRLPLVAAALAAGDWVAKVVDLTAPGRGTAYILDTVLKTAAMLALAIWVARFPRDGNIWTRRWPAVLALVASAGGDFITQRDYRFYFGVLAFLAVHLLYLGAIKWRELARAVRVGWRYLAWLAIIVGLTGLLIFLSTLRGNHPGCSMLAKASLVAAYATVSLATMLALYFAARHIRHARPPRQLASYGMAAFVLSDTVLLTQALVGGQGTAEGCPRTTDGQLVPALAAIVMYHVGQYAIAVGFANA